MSAVLIIDDEAGIRSVLGDILEDEGHKTYGAGDGYEGLKLLSENSIQLVFLDVWLPKMGGIEVLETIKQQYPHIQVIVISGHANIDIAVKAVKLGAFDFMEKPLSLERVITLTKNALAIETLKIENEQLKRSLFIEDEFIGSSQPMKQVREAISQSAKTDAKVLILGENGTGKELVAREIHRQSLRSEQAFVEVNCAAIPDTLLESELFGHEKGAFTGAVSSRKGKFEIADNGTLFLDEIADMSLSAQAKVLRVIQEQKFERIGGEKTVETNVRLIAATNKDLREEIETKKFREDLYFRLNVVPILVPPLRERKEDIEALIEYFLGKFNASQRHLTEEGLVYLKAYAWPGNVRELKNFIERISILSDDEIIDKETIEFFLGEVYTEGRQDLFSDFKGYKLQDARDVFEKQFIGESLLEHDGNISATATALGLYPSNLHAKIKKLGIELQK